MIRRQVLYGLIAVRLPLAEALVVEMAAFRATVTVTEGTEEMSWRDRQHDDLVLAVALAPWEGERNPPNVGMPLIAGDR